MALLRGRCAGRSRPQRSTEEGQAMYVPYPPEYVKECPPWAMERPRRRTIPGVGTPAGRRRRAWADADSPPVPPPLTA